MPAKPPVVRLIEREQEQIDYLIAKNQDDGFDPQDRPIHPPAIGEQPAPINRPCEANQNNGHAQRGMPNPGPLGKGSGDGAYHDAWNPAPASPDPPGGAHGG